jgi:hypothetical protein
MPRAIPAPPDPAAWTEKPDTGGLSSEDDVLAELAHLNATDKPRALALALSADDTYPSTGINAEARRAMIITLLVDLGRMAEARQRVYRYIATYPDSRYLPLVEGKDGDPSATARTVDRAVAARRARARGDGSATTPTPFTRRPRRAERVGSLLADSWQTAVEPTDAPRRGTHAASHSCA